jgi:NAD(P)-dependent dehydrogenase (short-subunit alcohol dehydrogenase family)
MAVTTDQSGRIDGKIALITGATSGIGYATARGLAIRGARLVISGRDSALTRRVASELARVTRAGVTPLVADLASQAGVRRLAEEVNSQFDHIDILINNAGGVFTHRQLTVDGIEMTLALNHLAPFLLTRLLLERLKASPRGRIITVASEAHRGVRVPFDDMNHARGPWRTFQVYGQSKLMNIMFTYELARRLDGSQVTANALHPGYVATNFGKNNGGLWKTLFALGQPFAISAEQGAQTGIFLATSPAVAQTTGKYFTRSKPASSSRESYHLEEQQRLWRMSEELTASGARG